MAYIVSCTALVEREEVMPFELFEAKQSRFPTVIIDPDDPVGTLIRRTLSHLHSPSTPAKVPVAYSSLEMRKLN